MPLIKVINEATHESRLIKEYSKKILASSIDKSVQEIKEIYKFFPLEKAVKIIEAIFKTIPNEKADLLLSELQKDAYKAAKGQFEQIEGIKQTSIKMIKVIENGLSKLILANNEYCTENVLMNNIQKCSVISALIKISEEDF